MEYAFYGIHTLLRTESTRRNITRYSILLLVIGLITYMSHFSRSGLGVLGFFYGVVGELCVGDYIILLTLLGYRIW